MFCFTPECRNCLMQIPSGTLCTMCASKRGCKRCRRHLDDHSFPNSVTSVCNACSRHHRSALDMTYHEELIPSTTTCKRLKNSWLRTAIWFSISSLKLLWIMGNILFSWVMFWIELIVIWNKGYLHYAVDAWMFTSKLALTLNMTWTLEYNEHEAGSAHVWWLSRVSFTSTPITSQRFFFHRGCWKLWY